MKKTNGSPAQVVQSLLETRVLSVPALLTEPDVAKILGISPTTLKCERSRGRIIIPYVKVGRLVRYRIEDVDRYIEENRKVPMVAL
jgi:hypothetical protein